MFNELWASVVVLAAALAVAPATPGLAQQPAPSDERARASEELTLTGCLEREPDSEHGRLVFRSRAGEQQAGAHGPGAAETTVQEYDVEPGKGVDLASRVGHRVRVVGRVRSDVPSDRRSNAGVSPSIPSGSTGMETIPPPTDEPRPPAGAEGTSAGSVAVLRQTLVVTRVETLAATCPDGHP